MTPLAQMALLAGGHLHRRPRQQDAAGAGVSGRLLSALHGHGIRRRSRVGGRSVPHARPAGGAVLRALHPHRSADVAGEVPGPVVFAADRRASPASPSSNGSARSITCSRACWSATSGKPGVECIAAAATRFHPASACSRGSSVPGEPGGSEVCRSSAVCRAREDSATPPSATASIGWERKIDRRATLTK